MRVALAVACGLTLVSVSSAAGASRTAMGQRATAADGGSGTFSATGDSYDIDLVNAGTTPWQFFYLVGPAGTSFVGGGTAGEITVRCVSGQPDGQANEIECGPLSANGLAPGTHVLFVGAVSAPAGCGGPFELFVSATGSPAFTRVNDVTAAGSCSVVPPPKAVSPPLIRGIPIVGGRLTASAPTWSPTPDTVAYQWQVCTTTGCRAVAAATKLTLELVVREARHSVRIVATATFGAAKVVTMSREVAVHVRRA